MTTTSVLQAILGGVLIGLASALILLFRGRMAGVSGILADVLSPKSGEAAWRALFLFGLAVGGLAMFLILPDHFAFTLNRSIQSIVIAGVLIGFGARLGGGCTSGHGICGVSRFSLRSILATLTFIVAGIVTVFVINRFLGGAL